MHELVYRIFDQPDEQIPLLLLAGLVVYGFWLCCTTPDAADEPSHEYDRVTGKVRRKR